MRVAEMLHGRGQLQRVAGAAHDRHGFFVAGQRGVAAPGILLHMTELSERRHQLAGRAGRAALGHGIGETAVEPRGDLLQAGLGGGQRRHRRAAESPGRVDQLAAPLRGVKAG